MSDSNNDYGILTVGWVETNNSYINSNLSEDRCERFKLSDFK